MSAQSKNYRIVDEPEDPWSRFILICKPEQSGKTFIMIQEIIKNYQESEEDKLVINFIFCDNNLLLTEQTSKRVNDEFEIEGERYIEFSSRKRRSNTANNSDSVKIAIYEKKIKNIICCTNKTRVSDIQKIINDLSSSDLFKKSFEFKIWLDEADKFTTYIDDTFREIVNSFSNTSVYCMTATPEKLFTKYKYMNVYPLEETTSVNYHGWNDNTKVIIEDKCISDLYQFIDNVMEKNPPENGSKWYIPADTKKRSHHRVRDMLVGKGCAVFIVNGDGISLTIPQVGKPLEHVEEKNDLLNIQILKMRKKYSVNDLPVIVTGNICVGRGISIMSEEFIFDYGILYLCHNKNEASQNAGRLKGNIKSYENYKIPTVFTTKRFDEIATKYEEKSRKLALKAFERQRNGESTNITRPEFITLDKNYEYIIHETLFRNLQEIRLFFTRNEHIWKKWPGNNKRSPCPKDFKENNKKDGYIITPKLTKIENMTPEERVTLVKSRSIGPGTCISTTSKGAKYLIIPVYESYDTPPEDVKFQLRYLKMK